MEYLIENWLEIIGLISGLLCVWLLIRENIWTFPIGLLYAVVTVVVVIRANLYADVILNLYYVVMNAYGWYFWAKGGGTRRRENELTVGWVPVKQWITLVLIGLAGTLLMGWYFATQTDAALPYPDSFTTVASFIAMWMSAKKYIESWILWFVIDVIQIVLYLIKGIELYALLYFVYLLMAVWGWLQWRGHMAEPGSSATA